MVTSSPELTKIWQAVGALIGGIVSIPGSEEDEGRSNMGEEDGGTWTGEGSKEQGRR